MKTKKRILIAILIVLALAGLIIYGFLRVNQKNAVVLTSEQLEENHEDETIASEIVVHVAGAVVNPGVYALKSNARVNDAIAAAGGMTAEADSDSLNLAATLSDGEKIHVYTLDETSGNVSGSAGGLININTASKEELMTLSGIGEVLAENIIAYREKNGGFGSKEELKEVDRIGEKLYERIAENITI